MKKFEIYLLNEGTKIFNVPEEYLFMNVNEYIGSVDKASQVKTLIYKYEVENLDGDGQYLIIEKDNNKTTYYVY